MDRASKGDWVLIAGVILEPAERAPGLPPDTAAVPYEFRLRGVAQADAELGEKVAVRTLGGRLRTGKLLGVNPAFRHDFGDCIPELIRTRARLMELTRRGGGR